MIEELEEFEAELAVIAEFIEDRTARAKLRGHELWYQAKRGADWTYAGELSEELVKENLLEMSDLVDDFNRDIKSGVAGPTWRTL